jgi:Kef-type K+ transport system membrane component KefB
LTQTPHRPRRNLRLTLFLASLTLVVGSLAMAESGRSRIIGTADRTARGAAPALDAPATHAAAGGHEDPVAPILLGVLVIILAARLGGHAFEAIGQPAVLGELLVGVLLGNLGLFGYHGLDFLKVDQEAVAPLFRTDHLALAGLTIDHLARIGVILLLFQVGLETSIANFRRVGMTAFVVAVLGVVAPMVLGYGVGAAMLPRQSWAVHLFLGATLCATSVGITARVLRDLKKTHTPEAQIILGAAVIDDVLGLLVLAVVQGIIASLAAPGGAGLDLGEIAWIFVKAIGFLFGALALGQYVSRSLFKVASRLHGGGLLVITALAFCFGLSYLASLVGLAPIVGAFAAGLILDRVQYRELAERGGHHELDELIRPIADLLVPIFFVMMGVQVDLRSFSSPTVLGLAGVLIAAAVLGKQVCALGVSDQALDRLSVGIGMIPRGEVGLIFAAIGRQLRVGGQRVVDSGTYSALVLMVIVTTLITPPLLKWSLDRFERRGNARADIATEPDAIHPADATA